MLEEKLRI